MFVLLLRNDGSKLRIGSERCLDSNALVSNAQLLERLQCDGPAVMFCIEIKSFRYE